MIDLRSLLVVALASLPLVASALEPGIVTVRPTEGRYVEVDGVFLVPYEATIPGTDVTFGMEPIPGGKTMLGDAREGKSQVEVQLAPYWIARYETSWAEYRPYMNLCGIFERFDDKGIRPLTDENRVDAITAPSKLYDPGFTFGSGEEPDLPAVTMSQYAAKQYTKWLSLLSGKFYRLPSEVEWEHACRAGTDTLYSFGDDPEEIDDYAWHEDNSDWETQPVGQKKPNPWGLYDMHGNACEWTLDAYVEEGLAALAAAQFSEDGSSEDGSSEKGSSEKGSSEKGSSEKGSSEKGPPVNWPTKLFPRVLRGGSILSMPDGCETTDRRGSDDNELREYDPNTPKSPWWFADDAAQDIGFRIVRPYHVPAREKRSRYWESDVDRILKIANHRIDNEGKGERGYVDPELPAAIEELNKKN